jgi:uncharacterized membrane protein YfcA
VDNKTLLIVLGALAVYFLFIRQPGAAPGSQYRPTTPPRPPQQSTTQQIVSGVTGALPALGQFFGGLFGGGGSSSSSEPDFSGYSLTGGAPYGTNDTYDDLN